MSNSKKEKGKAQPKKFLILQIKKLIIFLIIFIPLFYSLQLNKFGPWLESPFTKAPHLSWNGDARTTMGITWETPLPTDTLVRYGPTSACKNKIYDATVSSLHNVTLTNLQPNTTYYYRVGCSYPFLDYMIFTYTFSTAPNGTQPFSFAFYADTQQDEFEISQNYKVIQKMMATNPDFIIHCGDIVENSGRMDQWDRIFYELKFLTCNTPIMPTIGNHDYKYAEIAALPYLYYFNLPNNEIYYSYNYSNAHFISLFIGYSEGPFFLGGQREWLENDLSIATNSSEIDWIFVYFHAPMFSSGGFGTRPELIVQFWDLFEKYNVDMVFNGHDHIYERMYIYGDPGVHNIVFGGGGGALDIHINNNQWTVSSALNYGFGLISINNQTLTYQAINADGQIFDWLVWNK